MSIEKVRQYFQPLGREQDILEFETSSATVELAAKPPASSPPGSPRPSPSWWTRAVC